MHSLFRFIAHRTKINSFRVYMCARTQTNTIQTSICPNVHITFPSQLIFFWSDQKQRLTPTYAHSNAIATAIRHYNLFTFPKQLYEQSREHKERTNKTKKRVMRRRNCRDECNAYELMMPVRVPHSMPNASDLKRDARCTRNSPGVWCATWNEIGCGWCW